MTMNRDGYDVDDDDNDEIHTIDLTSEPRQIEYDKIVVHDTHGSAYLIRVFNNDELQRKIKPGYPIMSMVAMNCMEARRLLALFATAYKHNEKPNPDIVHEIYKFLGIEIPVDTETH